jgi:hypothetical protein
MFKGAGRGDVEKMKLSPEKQREILNEMMLAELFTEKRWAERFGISIPTVRRMRRKARDEFRKSLIPFVSNDVHVMCFTTPSKGENTECPSTETTKTTSKALTPSASA